MVVPIIHFAVLIVLVGMTIAAVIRHFKRPSIGRMALGVLAGLVSAAVMVTFSMHMCGKGQPLFQWALPAFCIAAAVLFIGKPLWRRSLAIIAFILGFVLSLQFASVDHLEDVEPGVYQFGVMVSAGIDQPPLGYTFGEGELGSGDGFVHLGTIEFLAEEEKGEE